MLALLIEVTSVGISGGKIKKPITGLVKSLTPKPPKVKAGHTPAAKARTDQSFDRAFEMMASTSKAARR